jgi:phosphohistidine phosphatase
MTQRRLVLVRHAKTEQGAPDLSRTLTNRGRRDAREVGRWLAANDVAPELVVVSPSLRTHQTWEIAGEQLATAPDVVDDQRIYDNTVSDLLAVARGTVESVRTLAIVGHNPSVHGCAVGLLGGVGAEAAQQLREFPTATVAVFALDGEWTDVGHVPATLAALTTCRG